MVAIQLSPREFEVVRLRASGLSNDEVGVRLRVATATVKNHVAAALAKADVHTFVELLTALAWLTIPDPGVSIAEVRHERLLWAHG